MRNEKIKRFSRFRFYFFNIVLFVVIVVLIAIMAALFLCPLGEVRVKGTDIYSAQEIEESVLTGKYDNNTVFAFLRTRFTPHKSMEFVESYSVSMSGRSSLTINVKQKEVRGYVLGTKDRYVYYDSEGNVVENTKRYVPDTFFVEGFIAKGAKKKEQLPIGSANVKTILTLQDKLESEGLNVDQVTFSEDGTISFSIGAIFINLGTRASLTEKIHRLPYILPQLEGQVGTLHLEEWSEENTDIVFEKTQ